MVNSVDLYIVLMVCCVCVASFILLLIGVAIFVAVCLLTWVVCLLFCSLVLDLSVGCLLSACV